MKNTSPSGILVKKHFTMIIEPLKIQFTKKVTEKVMMLDSSKIEEKEPSKEVLKNLKHEKARGFLEPSEKEKEDKTSVEIKQSMNFKDMLPMFIEAGLEFKPDSPDPESDSEIMQLKLYRVKF